MYVMIIMQKFSLYTFLYHYYLSIYKSKCINIHKYVITFLVPVVGKKYYNNMKYTLVNNKNGGQLVLTIIDKRLPNIRFINSHVCRPTSTYTDICGHMCLAFYN